MNKAPSWLASGAGQEIPLVLLHGMGSTAAIWLPQLDFFGRERPTLAWTMPGFGGSPALPELSWEGLANALADMFDAAGIERAHVLGHSVGGMIAQEFYHRYPQRVASLVLSATSAAFGSKDPAWTEDFLRQRTDELNRYDNFQQAAPHMLDKFMGARTPQAMRQLAMLAAHPIQKEAYVQVMRLLTTFDRKSDAASILAPALLLAGELDTQAPPKGMKRLAEQIPNGRFVQLDGRSHMANIEAPEEFNAVVQAFISAASLHTTHRTTLETP